MKKKLIIIGAGFLAVFLLSGCGESKIWTGFYYPDINKLNDESTWKIQPGFESLEDCRAWVMDMAKDNKKQYDYECGYGCRYEKGIGMNVCKETLD